MRMRGRWRRLVADRVADQAVDLLVGLGESETEARDLVDAIRASALQEAEAFARKRARWWRGGVDSVTCTQRAQEASQIADEFVKMREAIARGRGAVA